MYLRAFVFVTNASARFEGYNFPLPAICVLCTTYTYSKSKISTKLFVLELQAFFNIFSIGNICYRSTSLIIIQPCLGSFTWRLSTFNSCM